MEILYISVLASFVVLFKIMETVKSDLLNWLF